MIEQLTNNLDYVVVIVLAVILYRMIGRPLSRKL